MAVHCGKSRCCALLKQARIVTAWVVGYILSLPESPRANHDFPPPLQRALQAKAYYVLPDPYLLFVQVLKYWNIASMAHRKRTQADQGQ